ncbi:hypothetical protein [Proteus mirabilis]|uniref:hypothetical protein n=1 Tax=Proteus mirabilis TaxID=584 RepID=UPI0034D42BFB
MLTISKRVITSYKLIESHRLNPEQVKPITECGFLLSSSLEETAFIIPEVAHTIAVMDEVYPEVKPYTMSLFTKSLYDVCYSDINSLVSKKGK